MKKGNKSEFCAKYFVDYLFNKYKGSRHVRRIATWIGFLLKAIERLPGVSFSINRVRQLKFEYKGQKFKTRFNHKAGPRGGIEIIYIPSERGFPEGKVVLSIRSLGEAENAYLKLKKMLDEFIKQL